MAAIFTTSAILSKCYQMGKMIWQEDPFQKFAKKLSGFFLDSYPTLDRIAQVSIQILLIILFEVVPSIYGLVMGFVTLDPTIGVQYFLSFGGFFAMVVCVLWLGGSLLENYKRFISFFICCRKDYKIKKMQKEIGLEKKDDDIIDHIDYNNESNFWNLLTYYCCDYMIKFSHINKKLTGHITTMSIWRFFFLLAGVSIFVILGVVRFWVAFAFL